MGVLGGRGAKEAGLEYIGTLPCLLSSCAVRTATSIAPTTKASHPYPLSPCGCGGGGAAAAPEMGGGLTVPAFVQFGMLTVCVPHGAGRI